MADDDETARMRSLDERIARARKAHEPPAPTDSGYSRGELAWRMVIELVAGLLIGFGIGYGLDYLLGTMPLFLVLFVLLGFVAGVRVMMRTAAEVTKGQGPDGEGT